MRKNDLPHEIHCCHENQIRTAQETYDSVTYKQKIPHEIPSS